MRRLQLLQWQIAFIAGSPSTSIEHLPQQHDALRIIVNRLAALWYSCAIGDETVKKQAALVSLLVVLLFTALARAQQNQTLADVLNRRSISSHANAVAHLNDPITSYAILDTNREFLIAYYLLNPGNELQAPLFLTRFDKSSGEWQQAQSDPKTISDGTGPLTQLDCIGSAINLERSADWYYLDLHLNPSAGCLVVLNHDLTVNGTLTGFTAAHFKSGLLVYQGNAVHFAAVHPLTLFLYDPITRKSQQIYPPERDPFRAEFSHVLEKVIDEKRCQENDWPCDPKDFESDVLHPIEVSDETHALAFRVEFSMQGFVPPEDADRSSKLSKHQYVYVYQLDPIRWREFAAGDLKREFGTDSIRDLVTPEKLRQVFATQPPQ